MRKIKQVEYPKYVSDVIALHDNNPIGKIFKLKDYAGFLVNSEKGIVFYGLAKDTPVFGDPATGAINCPIRRETGVLPFIVSHYGLYNSADIAYIQSKLKKVKNFVRERLNDWNRLCDVIEKIAQSSPAKTMQFGVELELESDNPITDDNRKAFAEKHKDLIYDFGGDCSVIGGSELRFNHPTMCGWKLDRVSAILQDAKEMGLKSEWGTAGMHIHISAPNIKKAVERFKTNIDVMQSILYPISCRKRYIGRNAVSEAKYGIGKDIWRDQLSDFGTLEIRAWSATTDSKVFLARLRIAKAIIKFLLSDAPVKIDNFFKSLTTAQKRDYKFLLKTENPREYGLPDAAIFAMM